MDRSARNEEAVVSAVLTKVLRTYNSTTLKVYTTNSWKISASGTPMQNLGLVDENVCNNNKAWRTYQKARAQSGKLCNGSECPCCHRPSVLHTS